MNWTTEVPKESGWYWAKLSTNTPEVLYIAPDLETVWVIADTDPRELTQVIEWGNKLEIPE